MILAVLLAGIVQLTLPHLPHAGERVWLRIDVGALPRAAALKVETADGVPIGLVSPFGLRPGQSAGLYTLPLPKSAIVNGHVGLKITVVGSGPSHAPDPDELQSVELIYVPVSDQDAVRP